MPQYTFDQFIAARRYQGNIAFAPDGSEVAYITDTSGQFNIWRQSVRGGWPFQVTTFETNTVRQVQWAPSGHLYFLADNNGDEKFQVYRVPAQGGLPVKLTDRPDVQYRGLALSRCGAFLYYSGNAVEPTQTHVFRHHITAGQVETLCGGAGTWVPAAESPDGRYLAVLNARSNSRIDLHLCDLQTGELTPVTGAGALGRTDSAAWADGGLYYNNDAQGEFVALCRYDLTGGCSRQIAAPPWDVEDVGASGDGRYLFWTVNEGGRTRPYMRDTQRVADLPLPAKAASGVLESFALSPDGRRLAFRISAVTTPGDMYTHDFETGETCRLTYSMLGGIDEADLVEPELVHFPSFDREIPAWLYRPRNVAAGQRVPAVLSIHGGPEIQEKPVFNAIYQYLLDQGVAVLAPNIRGSTGYGKSYQKLIQRDWGGGDLQDLKACAEYLRSLPWIDPDRIGIRGGSYGGFATLQALTRLPEYWACGAEICGPSNLVTLTRACPPTWRERMKGMIGDPDEDREMLLERSPVTYADSLRCPLLIVQGALDPRVPRAESDQMVERLQSRGIAVEYMVIEDEGHGFTKRHNQLKVNRSVAGYLVKHLVRPF